MNTTQKIIAGVVIFLVGIAAGMATLFVLQNPPPNPDPGIGTGCTMEAKICPDGSAVGRQGPNCEFTPCPGGGVPGVPERPMPPEQQGAGSGCAVGGCSGQLCASADELNGHNGLTTTCEWTASYACYRSAECKKQANGKCGWTQSPELKACLANPPQE